MARFRRKRQAIVKIDPKMKKAIDHEIDKRERLKHPVETKQVSSPIALFTMNDTIPNEFPMNAMLTTAFQQGPGDNQRIGSIIYIKRIQIALCLAVANTGSDASVRVLLVRYEENNGTSIGSNASDFFNNVSADNTVLSAFNVDTVPEKYRVLYDKIHHITTGSSGAVSTTCVNKVIRINKRFKTPYRTQFAANSVATSYAGIEQGLISLMVVQTSTTGTVRNFCNGYYSVEYTDE